MTHEADEIGDLPAHGPSTFAGDVGEVDPGRRNAASSG